MKSVSKVCIITVKINIKLNLWSAIKMRIAGFNDLNKKLKKLSSTSQIKEETKNGKRRTKSRTSKRG